MEVPLQKSLFYHFIQKAQELHYFLWSLKNIRGLFILPVHQTSELSLALLGLGTSLICRADSLGSFFT